MNAAGPNGRVAIVDGCRTPFAKAGGALAEHSSLDLALIATRALASRNGLAPGKVQSMILGSVYTPEHVPYLARQAALSLGWDDIDAYSTECACASGARAVVNAAYQIASGEHEVVVAGGAESLSQRPIYAPPAARAAMTHLPNADELEELLAATLTDLVPPSPTVTEPYSGRTLLEHAEDMVREWDVPREEADAFAVDSHRKAAAAWDRGIFSGEVVAADTANGLVREDVLVRRDTSLGAVAALSPVENGGTVTAATASQLTDGASAVLLMSERAAEAAAAPPRAFVRSWAFTGQSPALGALIGPVFALGKALDLAGLRLSDLALVDLHEAFAGQVIVNMRAMASESFARQHLGRATPVGVLPASRLNVNGGSIALGHPFGATGGRMITQSVNELQRRGGAYSAVAICAGGARGAAIVLEAP